MKCTMLPPDMQLPNEPFAFSLQALVEKLHTVQDLRDPRGIRYPLPVVLTVAVLAKLAGHSQLRAVAEWAGLRSDQLCPLLGFGRAALPDAPDTPLPGDASSAPHLTLVPWIRW